VVVIEASSPRWTVPGWRIEGAFASGKAQLLEVTFVRGQVWPGVGSGPDLALVSFPAYLDEGCTTWRAGPSDTGVGAVWVVAGGEDLQQGDLPGVSDRILCGGPASSWVAYAR
jgi:hypothetical protein